MIDRSREAVTFALVLVVGASAGPERASGQDSTAVPSREAADSVVLRGGIVDALSRRPLGSAFVLDVGSGARKVTQDGGEFTLALSPAETYTLRAGRFGYLDMEFEVTGELAGEVLILPLEPVPVTLPGLEVTVDRLAELERDLDRRTRAYARSARAIEADQFANSGATNALDIVLGRSAGLFECLDTPGEICARPRPSASLRGSPALERRVRVCLDEREAWGGTEQLRSIPAEEVHRIELYGLGGRDQIRVYTRWFMAWNSRKDARGLGPVEWGC